MVAGHLTMQFVTFIHSQIIKMKDLVLEFFQDKGFERLESKEELLLSDDFTEVELSYDGTMHFLVSRNIEIANFLNFKINISAWNKEKLFEVLEFFFIPSYQYERNNLSGGT